MAKKYPPPHRPAYSAKIRDMRKGESLFFHGASPDSIKALASRIGIEDWQRHSTNYMRKYVTRRENGGVRVWRLI